MSVSVSVSVSVCLVLCLCVCVCVLSEAKLNALTCERRLLIVRPSTDLWRKRTKHVPLF